MNHRVDTVVIAVIVFALLLSAAVIVSVGRWSGADNNEPTQSKLIPDGPVNIIIGQRETEEVPGSQAGLLITLGDITGGKVMLTMTDWRGEVIPSQAVEQGDVILFDWKDQTHYLSVVRLKNYLMGDDFAELRVSFTPPDETLILTDDMTKPNTGAAEDTNDNPNG